jgi:hypothetical protein
MLACFRARKTVEGNYAIAVDAPHRRFYMQERRKEEKSCRLAASAGGSCFRDRARESDARALQVGRLEGVDPLPNKLIPVPLVECVPRRCDPVNRPPFRFAYQYELLQQIPISNKSRSQPRDCVCLSVAGASCVRLERQFHCEHSLDFSPPRGLSACRSQPQADLIVGYPLLRFLRMESPRISMR